MDPGNGVKKLRFNQGSNFFRQRLVLSFLSSRAIKIEEIRSKSDLNVGLTSYEVSFLHLLDGISNGTRIKISETGTEVTVIPGALAGGPLTFSCDKSRPLSYYLEPILLLAPFCKKPLQLTLKGRIQNDTSGFNSVYKIKHAALPILEIIGLEPDIAVTSRSYDESEIRFTCTVKKQLLTLRNQLSEDCGKVKKVRGLAYGFRVSPQLLSRVVTAAKGVFLPFLSDVFLTSDLVKNSKSKVPGFGLVLYAETTKNIHYASDGFRGREEEDSNSNVASQVQVITADLSHPSEENQKKKFDLFAEEEADESEQPRKKKKKMESGILSEGKSSELQKKSETVISPEDLGTRVAKALLKEIASRSCVDSVYQWLVLGLMALGPKDVSSVLTGPLTPFTIQFLRDLRTFLNVTFRVENFRVTKEEQDADDDDDDDEKKGKLFKLSCLGSGYLNLNKTMV